VCAERADKPARLFFALWPDAAVRRRIAAESGPVLKRFRCNPVPAVNYHLTLAFLGTVARRQIPNLQAAAADVEFTPFDLELDTIGSWPRSRVAWLGASGCPGELTTLVDDLWSALGKLDFIPDSKPFAAHVTLARNFLGKVARELDDSPIEWPVREFVLVNSETLPEGAVYSVLARFPATARGNEA
jgi:2'-5' RNA ligase